jgi:hypothetical protein
LQAIESLQVSISDSGDYVKCQKHDMAIPILRTMIKPKSIRIAILEKQIKWIEEHYQYRHRHDNTSNNNDDGYDGLAAYRFLAYNGYLHYCYYGLYGQDVCKLFRL